MPGRCPLRRWLATFLILTSAMEHNLRRPECAKALTAGFDCDRALVLVKLFLMRLSFNFVCDVASFSFVFGCP